MAPIRNTLVRICTDIAEFWKIEADLFSAQSKAMKNKGKDDLEVWKQCQKDFDSYYETVRANVSLFQFPTYVKLPPAQEVKFPSNLPQLSLHIPEMKTG